MAVLADSEHDNGDEYELLWTAVLAQPNGERWDMAILAAWPDSERAREWLTTRTEEEPVPSAEWRASVFSRGKAAVEAGRGTRHVMSQLVALDGEALRWLDAYVANSWPEQPKPNRASALRHLRGRLHYPTAHALGSTPMAPELIASGGERSRALLERAFAAEGRSSDVRWEDFCLATHWLRRTEDREAIAWLDAELIERWPAPDFPGLQWATVEAARANTTTEAWKNRAYALATGAGEEHLRNAAEVLLYMDDREGSHDRALDSLMARWTTGHQVLLMRHWEKGSEAWGERTLDEIDRRLELGPQIETFESEGPVVPRRRAAHLGLELLGEDGDCERIRRYAEVSHFGVGRPQFPQRCRRR